jgi:hypothetical protein
VGSGVHGLAEQLEHVVVREADALPELLQRGAFVGVHPPIGARHQCRERHEEVALLVGGHALGDLADARVDALIDEVGLGLDRRVVERLAEERGVHRDQLRALAVVEGTVGHRDQQGAGDEGEAVTARVRGRRLGGPRGDCLARIGEGHASERRRATRRPSTGNA